MTRPIQIVDVFGDSPFTGNPLAVVLDGGGLDTETMQRITRWMNLSETTFLLPPTTPDADYRARIFTLDRELPFAGHPTLGSCHAWLRAGGKPRGGDHIVQECGAGLVRIRRVESRLAFAAPPLRRSGPLDEATLTSVADFLRIDAAQMVETRWTDNGPGWIGVLLDSAEAVLALEPARSHAGRMEVGVVGPHPAGGPVAFELRALFTDQHGGVREDPVTGSLNASVAEWLFETGRAHHAYVAAQGTRIGHRGRIYLSQDPDGQVWVAGGTTSLVDGEMPDIGG